MFQTIQNQETKLERPVFFHDSCLAIPIHSWSNLVCIRRFRFRCIEFAMRCYSKRQKEKGWREGGRHRACLGECRCWGTVMLCVQIMTSLSHHFLLTPARASLENCNHFRFMSHALNRSSPTLLTVRTPAMRMLMVWSDCCTVSLVRHESFRKLPWPLPEKLAYEIHWGFVSWKEVFSFVVSVELWRKNYFVLCNVLFFVFLFPSTFSVRY